MVPMRHSTIFKNRYMALLWAAGIIYAAVDFAGGSAAPKDGNNADATSLTDADGNPVNQEDVQRATDALANL